MRADVVALPHALGRIVILPEDLQQALIGDFLRVIGDQHRLGVSRPAAAGLLVGRVRGEAAGIADRGDINALAGLPEFALGAPEAAHAENGGLDPGGVGALQRVSVYEMLCGGGDRLRAARQGVGGRGQVRSFLERKLNMIGLLCVSSAYSRPRRASLQRPKSVLLPPGLRDQHEEKSENGKVEKRRRVENLQQHRVPEERVQLRAHERLQLREFRREGPRSTTPIGVNCTCWSASERAPSITAAAKAPASSSRPIVRTSNRSTSSPAARFYDVRLTQGGAKCPRRSPSRDLRPDAAGCYARASLGKGDMEGWPSG